MVRKDFECSWCGTIVELQVPSSVSETGCVKDGCPGVMKVIFRSAPNLSAAAIPTRIKTTRETEVR